VLISSTLVSTADAAATALDPESRKPSARSRSLRDISALSAPPARIGVPEATRRARAVLALSVHQVTHVAQAGSPFTVGPAVRTLNGRTLTPQSDPWRTGRARRGRVQFSRCVGQYPRGRCGERGYPTQRPRARRGLPSHYDECGRGGVCSRICSHSKRNPGRLRPRRFSARTWIWCRSWRRRCG